jgi:hypothetical protein
MILIPSFRFSLAMLEAEPTITADGWEFAPFVTIVAVVLIIGFAVAAAGWVIKRDV